MCGKNDKSRPASEMPESALVKRLAYFDSLSERLSWDDEQQQTEYLTALKTNYPNSQYLISIAEPA